jgi:hypothetical protein
MPGLPRRQRRERESSWRTAPETARPVPPLSHGGQLRRSPSRPPAQAAVPQPVSRPGYQPGPPIRARDRSAHPGAARARRGGTPQPTRSRNHDWMRDLLIAVPCRTADQDGHGRQLDATRSKVVDTAGRSGAGTHGAGSADPAADAASSPRGTCPGSTTDGCSTRPAGGSRRQPLPSKTDLTASALFIGRGGAIR